MFCLHSLSSQVYLPFSQVYNFFLAGKLQKDKNQSFYEGLQMKNKQVHVYPVSSVYTVS